MTFYGQYAIYSLPRPDEIIIVRILHGSRDTPSSTPHLTSLAVLPAYPIRNTAN